MPDFDLDDALSSPPPGVAEHIFKHYHVANGREWTAGLEALGCADAFRQILVCDRTHLFIAALSVGGFYTCYGNGESYEGTFEAAVEWLRQQVHCDTSADAEGEVYRAYADAVGRI